MVLLAAVVAAGTAQAPAQDDTDCMDDPLGRVPGSNIVTLGDLDLMNTDSEGRVVVGRDATPRTPTPRGRFAIYEVDRQPDPGGFLGPVALHLTAHSDVLDDYGGGPGRIAIHGRGGASLAVPLGSAASHGCIRVDSGQAAWLARAVSPGVPVTVR